jgi:hypothetical protein
MQLSRGWGGLILFWAVVVALGGIGTGTLQVLGSPSAERSPVHGNDAASTTVEFASLVPLTPFAVAPAAADVVAAPDRVEEAAAPNAQEASPEPVAMARSETTAVADRGALTPDPPAASFDGGKAVADEAPNAVNESARPAARVPEKRLHLRIARDSKLCPDTTCYKWRLINQRAKSPRAATIDLAKLHLAPSLREAAENGDIQLIVDAVEHHRTIHGRDMIIFQATNLAGVLPPEAIP